MVRAIFDKNSCPGRFRPRIIEILERTSSLVRDVSKSSLDLPKKIKNKSSMFVLILSKIRHISLASFRTAGTRAVLVRPGSNVWFRMKSHMHFHLLNASTFGIPVEIISLKGDKKSVQTELQFHKKVFRETLWGRNFSLWVTWRILRRSSWQREKVFIMCFLKVIIYESLIMTHA